MKAILEFNLPEDESSHKLAVKAPDMYCVLWDIDQWLRGKLKYGDDFKDADDALEKTREELHDLLQSHGVDLDELGG